MKTHRCFIVGSILAGALFSGADAGAATTQENLSKYNALRQRLTTQFMSVGEGPGESQPATERHDGQGFIKWSDGTINLGWYLGILATEHAIRSQPAIYPGATGSDPKAADKTLDELHAALVALERLDRVADAAFPSPCGQSQSVNGFFLRDDVPAGFHQRFPPLTSTQSDFIDPVLTNKEMSQDQVYHLLLGLSLVKHLVPASATVKGKVLKTWAAEQSKRIGQHFATGTWTIKNPACSNRTVNRGGQAGGYAAGTKLAFAFLSDGTYAPSAPLDLWSTLKSPSNPTYNDADNLHMAMAIAAVGDGWGATTTDDLATLSAKQDWVLYPILHRVLHGAKADGFCKTTGAALNTRARTMIDELPLGAEPANPRPGPAATHGFTSSNRFIRSKDQSYVGQNGGDGMRYSGTDFLLLHNLYALATPAIWIEGTGVAPCATPKGGGTSSSSGGASSSSGGGPTTTPTPPGNGSSSGDGASADGTGAADDSSSGCSVGGFGTRGLGGGALAVVAALLVGWRRRRSTRVRW